MRRTPPPPPLRPDQPQGSGAPQPTPRSSPHPGPSSQPPSGYRAGGHENKEVTATAGTVDNIGTEEENKETHYRLRSGGPPIPISLASQMCVKRYLPFFQLQQNFNKRKKNHQAQMMNN